MNNIQAELISEIEKNQRILEAMNHLENTIKEKDNYIELMRNDLKRLRIYDREYGENFVKCDCECFDQKNGWFVKSITPCKKCNGDGYFIKK